MTDYSNLFKAMHVRISDTVRSSSKTGMNPISLSHVTALKVALSDVRVPPPTEHLLPGEQPGGPGRRPGS